MTDYIVITIKDRPDLVVDTHKAINASWPQFMLHGFQSNQYWKDLYHAFPEFQFALIEISTNQVIALGNSIPLALKDPSSELPERGWDWALEQGIADHTAKRPARMLCALAISVLPAYRGRSISPLMVQAMKAISTSHKFESLIVPLRPLLKSRYPLIPMEQYINWQDGNGLPFDPWMRVHARLGGEALKVCHHSMIIKATITEWEEWTGMQFPKNGLYAVPEALTPVEIDLDKNVGIYVEPNVWVRHSIR